MKQPEGITQIIPVSRPLRSILDEGAITLSKTLDHISGYFDTKIAWAAHIDEGDWVTVTDQLWDQIGPTRAMTIVKKYQFKAIEEKPKAIGLVVSLPVFDAIPKEEDKFDTLGERLSGRFLRTALIEWYLVIE